jgi:hypothetical protein
MIENLKTRLNLLKNDVQKLKEQTEKNIMSGSYDEWKEILKAARKLENLAITRMTIIKYKKMMEK